MSEESKTTEAGEADRLLRALAHVGHYFQSPKSYSAEELAFVVKIVVTEGRCLEPQEVSP